MDNQKEYSRYMSNFRGIDTTSEASNVALNRFSFIQNMYKDYRSGQGVAIETFPGARTLCKNLGGKIYGIHTYKVSSGKVHVIVHAGTKLYHFDSADRDKLNVSNTAPVIFSDITMNEAKSSSFVYNNRLYIIDGEHYITVYEDEDDTGNKILKADYVSEKASYIPTTYANDVQYEQRNMLTDKFIERKFFEKAEVNDSMPFEETGGEWEYNGQKYGVICAIISDTYREVYDENIPMSYYELGQPSWDKKCTIDSWKVKIDFDKVVTNKITNSNGSNIFYDTPIFVRKTVKADNETTASGTTTEDRKNKLTTIILTDTVEVLEGTLEGCSNLSELILSNNIKSLEERFFAGTTNLKKIYLPASLEKLGDGAFDGSGVTEIYASDTMYNELIANYAKDKYVIPDNVAIKEYDDENISGSPTPNIYNEKNRIYIYSPCIQIEKVMLGKKELSEYDGNNDNGEDLTYQPVYYNSNGTRYIIAIELKTKKEKDVSLNIFIHGVASPYKFSSVAAAYIAQKDKKPFDESDASFKGSKPEYAESAFTAIKHCTVCCTFDDRIFFTGNPDLPNTVFYTQRDLTGHNNPTYVGVLNWFDDGMGNTPNVAMMSNASTLMVLKGNTLQDGSIYYHTGADGGNDLTPRIYPSVEGLAGLGCVGMAVNFRDDCVFMSNQGLEAIAKQTVNLERTIQHRSTNIDGLMLHSELASARAAEWEGYLCILINGKMFLADSRQAFEGIGGAMEYEWYYVADVCGYDGDNLKYFLADYMPDFPDGWKPEGLGISEDEDRSVNYSEVLSSFAVRYIVRDGIPFLVDSNGEMENGTPDMACEICAVEDVLFFGTEGGKLLCLNNDKRGTNKEEPDKSRIPVEWYNNSGHAYDAVAVLAMENAGVPHYTKTTVKRGTVLRLKAFPQSSFEVYATTDRQATTLLTSQSNSVTTFDTLDFENLGLLTSDSGILRIKEKTKKWVEKQYKFMSGKMNRPFGLYSLTYRYIIAGDVKNK